MKDLLDNGFRGIHSDLPSHYRLVGPDFAVDVFQDGSEIRVQRIDDVYLQGLRQRAELENS